MHKIITPITPSALFRPACKHQLQYGLLRGNALPRLYYLQKAGFSASHSPNFRPSKSHAKWTVPQSIQNWWSALKVSFGSKPPREVISITKELSNSNPQLSITVVNNSEQKPENPNPPKPKKQKKKSQTPIYTKSKHPPNKHFDHRLQQILCYFYAGVLNGTEPASPSVKNFIATTHFTTAFHLLSQAVLPETKLMISSGTGLSLATHLLRKDCIIPNQGCYMNIITTPTHDFGVYIGGSGSTSHIPRSLSRPLRGRVTEKPYITRKPGMPCGVGRRIAQHLDDGVRMKKKASPHYRFMEQKGNRYDFRLLAAFEEKVDVGAVWLLEAFFVMELGTMPVRGAVRDGFVVPPYVGLNRSSPLLTHGKVRSVLKSV